MSEKAEPEPTAAAAGRRREMTVERVLPGVRVLRRYERSWLRQDLVAGVVLATLLVPQGMAYADLAGLPAITGLYATVACLLAYALVGPSPILVLGPDSALGSMIAATVIPLAAGKPEDAVALAGALAIIVGIVTVGAGLLKLGFVADLLSNPVRTGYLAGLAVVIFVGQLPKLFGFSVDAESTAGEAVAFVQSLEKTNPWALGIGLVSLAIIVGSRRLVPRAPGVLIAVVLAIAASIVFDLASRDVAVIGVLPRGLPLPSLPGVDPAELPLLLGSALGISLVVMGDTISVSGGFADRAGYEVDGNQELAGIGTANLAAGLFSGFPVSTSGSRTAVAFQSGAKTQLTGLVAAALVVAMLVAVPGLVRAMPQPVLAAVVIAASLSLFDVAELRRLWRIRKVEFALALACMLGVVFVGVLQGIVIAVVLSIGYMFKRMWSPYSAVLGKVPGVPGYHDVRRYHDAAQIPGLLIVRWSAPLFFANAHQFRDRIRGFVKASSPKPRWVIVSAEPITDIDTTAGEMIADLDEELRAAGVRLCFAELQSAVRDTLGRYGLLETMEEHHFFRTVTEGTKAFRRQYEAAGRAGGDGTALPGDGTAPVGDGSGRPPSIGETTGEAPPEPAPPGSSRH